jgi:hypothetical protein
LLARRAAFIRSDGAITETDGNATLKFTATPSAGNNVYAVIYHRNHIGIMSNNAVPNLSGVYTYDYSTAATQIYDGLGTGGCKLVGTKWCMVAGDANGNGVINNDDFLSWQVNFAASNYNPADFDLTGVVNNDDFIIWQANFAQQTKIPN